MAKLPRVTAKIFASKANPADIGQFGSALTGAKVNTADIAEIQALPAFEEGWREAVVSKRNYPTLQESNGQQKVAFQQIAYILQTGMPEWDANTEYFANTSFCQVNGVWYQSLTDNNIGNNPTEDKTNWKEISSGGSTSGGASLPIFTPILQDHILSLEESKGYALQGSWVYKDSTLERYGYPDFYAKCLEEKAAGVATQTTLGDTTITTYNNPNGHIFYNIADKGAVDNFYNTYGTADMYGIDEVNERICLPRRLPANHGELIKTGDNFRLYSDGYAEIFGIIESSTFSTTPPNFSAVVEFPFSFPDPSAYDVTISSISDTTFNVKLQVLNSVFETNKATLYFNRVSNDTYGKDKFLKYSYKISGYINIPALQPQEYCYFVVGNTEATSATTEVMEVTTSQNDTIPLFTAQYFDFAPNNASWLKAGEQTNSGGIYSTAYNTLVNCINGHNPYNLKVVETSAMTAGVDYSTYWKVNQTNQTFTCPAKVAFGFINPSVTKISAVGNGMSLGLTNGSQNTGIHFGMGQGSSLGLHMNGYGDSIGTVGTQEAPTQSYAAAGVVTDPEKSGIVANISEALTQAQLYFKVANAVENLELLNVGEVLNALSDKIGFQDCVSYVTETYQNGDSWYRLYSDGWCEQGGSVVGNATVTLLKEYSDVNYTVQATLKNVTDSYAPSITSKAVNSFTIDQVNANRTSDWSACGYTPNSKMNLRAVERSEISTVIDTALSPTSTNPVQNRAIYKGIQDSLGSVETSLSTIIEGGN